MGGALTAHGHNVTRGPRAREGGREGGAEGPDRGHARVGGLRRGGVATEGVPSETAAFATRAPDVGSMGSARAMHMSCLATKGLNALGAKQSAARHASTTIAGGGAK